MILPHQMADDGGGVVMQHSLLLDIVKSQVDLVSTVVGARGATLRLRLRDEGGQIQVWLVTN